MTRSLPAQASSVGRRRPPRARRQRPRRRRPCARCRGFRTQSNGCCWAAVGHHRRQHAGHHAAADARRTDGLGRDALVVSHDVGAARTQLRILAASFKQDIPVAAVTNLSMPGPAADPARHYRPIDGEGAPLLVFYHGGGQVIGDLDTHDDLCRQICREGGLHVLSVDYRLAPEHKAPAAADDAYAAFRWATRARGRAGRRPRPGGRRRRQRRRQPRRAGIAACADEGARLPAMQLLLYPVTNYSGETRSQTFSPRGSS